MRSHFFKGDKKYRLVPFIFICLFVTGLFVSAQTEGATALVPGEPEAGALTATTIAQIFSFDAVTGDVIDLVASSEDNLALSLLLTDSAGALVAQARDTAAVGETRLSATATSDGTFFVTVLPVVGVGGVTAGDYTLTLTLNGGADSATEEFTPEATPVPEATDAPEATAETTAVPAAGAPVFEEPVQVVTTSGMQVSLTWDTTADMDLEVRDPVGGALFFNNPVVDSGGTFDVNVNGGCQALTANSPTEQASWSPGGIPSGSYEILVYYQQGCENTAPVSFIVNVTVDGVALDPVEGTLLPGQVFIASYTVEPDGSASLNSGAGVRGEAELPASAAVLIQEAQPIQVNTPIESAITNEFPYQTYTFTAAENDVVTITMNAFSGSLDPYVALLDPTGNVIFFNDDAAEGVTDSAINNARLVVAGDYTVVASRYGLAIGGTEGGFTLNVATGAATLTPQDLLATEQVAADTDVPVAVAPADGLPLPDIALPEGNIEVTLLWDTAADIQLLVRDPAGEAVYDDVPTIRSGGRLGAAGNVNCSESDLTPLSYVYWPTNIAPRAGSYEIDIWFQSECNDTTPVNFTLYVSVFGQQIMTQSLRSAQNPFLPGDHYITSFTIDQQGNVFPGDGGISGLETLNWEAEAASALAIAPGETINGAITLDNKFDLFAFEALAGDVVSVSMTAAPDTNLDPNLFLIGPSGNVVAQNDDAVPGENTNSLINNFTLPEDGQYIIIATHYGERFGVSQGAYTLTLSQSN